ncbi:MAG: DUF3999 family protein [Planctomycetes bacterium]|nr:DUF3999 family protein [Planctomycetota bacterium]
MKHPINKIAGLVWVMLLCTACGFGAEGARKVDQSKWKYRLPVSVVEDGADGVDELSLPPALLAKAKGSLSDLRLIDGQGDTVPYITREQRGREEYVAPYGPGKYLNKAFVPGKSSSVVADFGGNQVRNILNIVTAGDNFRRRVMVEGGNDAVNWQVLTNNGWLFAIPGGASAYRLGRLPLSENNYRYYRITVYNGINDPEQIEINSVSASHLVKTPADVVAAPVSTSEVLQNSKGGYTEIRLDLGFENLHLYDIKLTIGDDNFMRRCSILGRNAETRIITRRVENSLPSETEVEEQWSEIAHASLYRFTTGKETTESLELKCDGKYRYLAIRIYNGDDAPLSFVGASVRRLNQRLIFRHNGKRALQLLCGNPDASSPSYDFASFVDRLQKDGIHKAVSSEVEDNPQYSLKVKEIPWSERNQWLLTAAVILLVAVLAILIWKQAKQIPEEDGGKQG